MRRNHPSCTARTSRAINKAPPLLKRRQEQRRRNLLRRRRKDHLLRRPRQTSRPITWMFGHSAAASQKHFFGWLAVRRNCLAKSADALRYSTSTKFAKQSHPPGNAATKKSARNSTTNPPQRWKHVSRKRLIGIANKGGCKFFAGETQRLPPARHENKVDARAE